MYFISAAKFGTRRQNWDSSIEGIIKAFEAVSAGYDN